jgi:hypothetical protein
VLPWLWLAWVVVLLALLWMVTTSPDGTSGTPPIARDSSRPPGTYLAITELAFFVVERGAERHGQLDREDIADGIARLAAALHDLAAHENIQASRLRDQIDEIAAAAALLRDDRLRERHAFVARSAFAAAAGVIDAIQSSRYPDLDRAAAEAREAALTIRADQPLLAQTAAVQRFFERSYDVLRAIMG